MVAEGAPAGRGPVCHPGALAARGRPSARVKVEADGTAIRRRGRVGLGGGATWAAGPV